MRIDIEPMYLIRCDSIYVEIMSGGGQTRDRLKRGYTTCTLLIIDEVWNALTAKVKSSFKYLLRVKREKSDELLLS